MYTYVILKLSNQTFNLSPRPWKLGHHPVLFYSIGVQECCYSDLYIAWFTPKFFQCQRKRCVFLTTLLFEPFLDGSFLAIKGCEMRCLIEYSGCYVWRDGVNIVLICGGHRLKGWLAVIQTNNKGIRRVSQTTPPICHVHLIVYSPPLILFLISGHPDIPQHERYTAALNHSWSPLLRWQYDLWPRLNRLFEGLPPFPGNLNLLSCHYHAGTIMFTSSRWPGYRTILLCQDEHGCAVLLEGAKSFMFPGEILW